MAPLGIIGGTGLDRLETLTDRREAFVSTPYGEPSAPLIHGRIGGHEVVFLARHGAEHSVPPHRINYRANLWALHAAGAESVVAIAAVGGIADEPGPGGLAVPDQLIDYTYGRTATFFDGDGAPVEHIDFTFPYTHALRCRIRDAAHSCGVPVADGGCYGSTQGPRLETAAEVRRLERDGCTLVGMTGMPEAALARELDLEYACCAVIANRAAGKGDGTISLDEIRRHLEAGMAEVRRVLQELPGRESPR
jgi:5'-deoxy-5'-methylthioadenosine phosphorylase